MLCSLFQISFCKWCKYFFILYNCLCLFSSEHLIFYKWVYKFSFAVSPLSVAWFSPVQTGTFCDPLLIAPSQSSSPSPQWWHFQSAYPGTFHQAVISLPKSNYGYITVLWLFTTCLRSFFPHTHTLTIELLFSWG